MRGVARFDRDVEPRALGRHVEEQPPVIDFEDVGAKLAEHRRDLAEHARPVRDGQAERDDAVSRSSSRTMIDARMRGSMLPPHSTSPTFLPANRSGFGQHRGQAGGARALRHGLLQGQIGVDRALDVLLVDQHDVADQRADDRQGERADILHRDAFGERRAAERDGCRPRIAFHNDG